MSVSFKQKQVAEAAGGDRAEYSYPLSPMQQGMLFHSLYDRRSGVEIEQMVYTLHEDLNLLAFMLAWQQVVDRHAILRSSFRWEGLDDPLQEVHSRVCLQWEKRDWRGLSEEEQRRRLANYLREDRRRGFELTEKTLNRMALFRTGESDYEFIWTFHHAIIDGRSFVTVLKEVFAYYEAFCKAQSLELPQPRPYRDYIDWLRGQDMARAEAFWRQSLKGFTSPTPLPVSRKTESRPGEGPGYDEQETRLSASATSLLKSLAGRNQVTLNNVVQGAWALLLSRYSGEQDIVFGATRACRGATIEGAESIVGPFINTLPMRIDVREDLSLAEWLKQIRARHMSLREFEHTPLVKIKEWSELAGGSPLFESILVFENYELDSFLRAQGESWRGREFKLIEQTNYPLALSAWGGRELLLKIAYDRGDFDDATITGMLRHLSTLLQSMAEARHQPVATLEMLTERERQQMLVDWNDTASQFPERLCIHQLFESQVEKTPEATAVAFESKRLSYRELNAKANQLAHYLRALGVGPELLVGLCLGRSIEMIVGLLAILKAGGAYVPLDPQCPQERLAAMLEDAQPKVLLTERRLLENLPSDRARTVCVDSDARLIAQQSNENLTAEVGPESLAYVIYTSGSTGKPKGVMVEHRSLVNHSENAAIEFEIEPGDRVLQFASVSFDASAEEIFPCLTRGACLVLRTDLMIASTSAFLDKCREWGITILDSPTAYWHELVESLGNREAEVPASLRLVIIGGESALPGRIALWQKHAGRRVRLVNTYGPTEATVVATACDLAGLTQRESRLREAPIGRAIRNVQTYILDRRMRPVPIGVTAHLYVGGAGVARGYWNRPDLTSEKFVANPFVSGPGRIYKTGDLARYLPDGNIEFCGRADDQVKIHGFRIELGDIEAAATGSPAVKEAVVLAKEDAPGDKKLIAYIVPAPGYASVDSAAIAQELRAFLKRKLPAYMLPNAYVTVASLPLNRNGKVDRNSLPSPGRVREDTTGTYTRPRDPLEYQLVQIWEELFNISPIGITDNFFDLGGHSLLSVRMMDRIERVTGKKLPLATLFSGATIEHLAEAIVKQETEGGQPSLVEIQAKGSRKPFFYLHGDFNGGGLYCLSLARLLGDDQPFYAIQPHGLDGQPMPSTIEAIAEDHIKTLRAFQPVGPYLLGGHCNAGLVAFEMARRLEAAGQEVELLVIICAAATNARYRRLQDVVNRYCSFRGFSPDKTQGCFLSWRSRHIRLEEIRRYYGARFKEFSQLSARGRVELIAEKGLKPLKSIAASLAGRKKSGEPSDGLTSPSVESLAPEARRQEITKRYVKAMNSYVPRPYSGRVTLLWPAESPFEHSNDPTWGWRDVATEVDVHTIPGGHLTCITKHAPEMADVLRKCLARAQTTG